MNLKITEPRLWYLAMLTGLLAGIAMALHVKPVRSHGTAFEGCPPPNVQPFCEI